MSRDFYRGEPLNRALTARRLNELKNAPVLEVIGDGLYLLAQRNGQEVIVRPSELLLEAIRRAGGGGGESAMRINNIFVGLASDNAGVPWTLLVRDVRNTPPIPVNLRYPHFYFYDMTATPPAILFDCPIGDHNGIGAGIGGWVPAAPGLSPGHRYAIVNSNFAGIGHADLTYEVRIGPGDAREYPVVGGAANVLTLTWAGRAPSYIGHVVNEFVGGRLIPDITSGSSYEITANQVGGANFTVTVASGVNLAPGATARIIPPGDGSEIAVASGMDTGLGMSWNVNQSG